MGDICLHPPRIQHGCSQRKFSFNSERQEEFFLSLFIESLISLSDFICLYFVIDQFVILQNILLFDSFIYSLNYFFLCLSSFSPDVDECEAQQHDCSQFAGCLNSVGSYSCTCFSGFTGDGKNCSGEYHALLTSIY